MQSPPRQRLEGVVAALQRQWGAAALRPLRELRLVEGLPTGLAALDQALSQGGLPCGGITQIAGQPTAGRVTLALQVVAHAQAAGYAALILDPARTLDLDHARRCGVDLDRLALVWPQPAVRGLEIVQDIAAGRIAAVCLFDATALAASRADAERFARALCRARAALAGSPGLLLCLTAASHTPCAAAVAALAALRLRVERVSWLRQGRDVTGWQARISVLRDPHGRPGRVATVALHLGDVAQGAAP